MRHSLLVVSSLILAVATATAQQRMTIVDPVAAREFAWKIGLPVRLTSEGRVAELQAFVAGVPRYYVTSNKNAADTISTDEVHPGGSTGFSLSGSSLPSGLLGVWDEAGVRLTHQEFGGRAVQRDNPQLLSNHATHVAGTMIAAGVDALSKGMAFAGRLDCYDWNSDLSEMDTAAKAGLRTSNHSYGLLTGWYYCPGCFTPPCDPNIGWFWFGDVRVSKEKDYWFGYYDELGARKWDEVVYANPRYLPVKAAGNDRDDVGPPPSNRTHYYLNWAGWDPNDPNTWFIKSTAVRFADGSYQLNNDGLDCIETAGLAKNVLTVGATNDIIGGIKDPNNLSQIRLTPFSSTGPADDGRIKPDVVGNGFSLRSCVAGGDQFYDSYSGTSMASPNVSGSLALLVEQWRKVHKNEPDLLAATLKALVIHTADDGGRKGPDYQFGWGLMNTDRAATAIFNDSEGRQPQTITELELRNTDAPITIQLPVDPDAASLWVTICWTDPPGTPYGDPNHPDPNLLDNRKPALVNDLDLRVTWTDPNNPSNKVVYEPWILNLDQPHDPATRGDNVVDNVEQVVVGKPVPGLWSVTISHKGTLVNDKQAFGMIVTGLIPADCNKNGFSDLEDIRTGRSKDCDLDLTPDECQDPNLLVPQIVKPPESTVACQGTDVAFSVEALAVNGRVNDPNTLTFQWRKNGVDIPGATSSVLQIKNVGPADLAEYAVVVTDQCVQKLVTSPTATITLNKDEITQQPQSLRVLTGDPAEFRVAAEGSGALTYQWRKDGVPIAGATGTTYSIASAQFEDAGVYDVVVVGTCATLVSQGATLEPVMRTPSAPVPAPGAQNVRIDVNLSWGPVTGAESYDVHFGTTTNPPQVGSAETPRWSERGLAYSTTYYWRVSARRGNNVVDGPLWSFTTQVEPLKVPEPPAAPFPGDGAVDVPLTAVLRWASAQRAEVYKVLIGTTADLKDVRFDGTTLTTNWSLLSLAPGTKYYWRIIAKNAAGETNGPIWSFTTTTAQSETPAANDQAGRPGIPPGDTPVSDANPPADSNTPASGDDSQSEQGHPTGGAPLCPATGLAMTLTSLIGLWTTWPRRRAIWDREASCALQSNAWREQPV